MADSNYPVAMGIPVAESTTADTSYPERPAAFNRAKTEASLHALTHKGYPIGLVTALRGSLEAFPLRIWIVDNSGSMASSDGCRFVRETAGHGLVQEGRDETQEASRLGQPYKPLPDGAPHLRAHLFIYSRVHARRPCPRRRPL